MVSSGRVGDIIYFTELEKGQRVSQYPVNRLPTCLSVFSSSPHSCLPRNIVLILSWGLKGQCDLVLIVISSSTLNKVLYSNFIVIFFFFFFWFNCNPGSHHLFRVYVFFVFLNLDQIFRHSLFPMILTFLKENRSLIFLKTVTWVCTRF